MPPFIGYVPGDKGAIKLRLDNELTNWNVLLWYYIPVPEVVFEGTKGKLDAFLINIVGNMRMRAKDVKKDDKGKLYLEFTIRIDEISKAIGLYGRTRQGHVGEFITSLSIEKRLHRRNRWFNRESKRAI